MSPFNPPTPEDADDQFGSSRDSRLESFLRQAAPILAAERGMNETCRLKLQALAEGLRLPRALYDRAISELNRSNQLSQLTRTEQQFAQFLERELDKLPGGILSAHAETKAIQIGETKFQIAADRAREIVRQRASGRGIRRVSQTDAAHHLESMYRELLAGATNTEAEQAQRLMEIGRQWGLNPAECAAILKRLTDANSSSQRSVATRGWLIVFASVTGVLLVVITTAIYFIRNREQNTLPTGFAKGVNSTTLETIIHPPKWWSGELYQSVVKTSESNPDLRGSYLATTDLNPETRRSAYLQLSAISQDSRSPESVSAPALVAAILAAEPDPSIVATTIGEWASNLTPQNSFQLVSAAAVDSSRRAAALLFEFWALKAHEPVGKHIENRFFEPLGIQLALIPDQSQLQRLVTSARLTAFWNHLIEAAWTDSRAAVELFKRLQALDSGDIEQQRKALLAILASDASLWGELRDELELLVAAENDAGLLMWLEWADLKQESELSQWLLEAIARRLKVPWPDGDLARKVAIMRATLVPTTAETSEIKKRWEIVFQTKLTLIDNPSFPALPEPQKLANAAFVVNLALILHDLELQPVANFATFDAMVAAGVRNISAAGAPSDHKTVLSFRQVNKPATAIERQQLEQAIARFSDATASRSAQLKALSSMAEVADQFGDLAYSEAASLVRFLSSIDDSAELVEVEQGLARMRHWPNLSLAWIDSLESANASATTAARIYFALFGKNAQLNGPESWREELRTLGLQHLSTSIEAASDASADSPSRQWRDLETYIEELLVQRANRRSSTSTETGRRLSDASLVNRTQVQLTQQFLSNGSRSDGQRILRASDLVIHRFNESMARIVFLEELLAYSLASNSSELQELGSGNISKSRRTLAQRFLDAETQIIEHLLSSNRREFP